MDLQQIDSGKVILVVAVTFLAVIAFNVVLFFSSISKNTSGQINRLRAAAGQVRNPWEKEDAKLKELSEMVAGLKKNQDLEQKSDDEK